jgi:hypothetical protein
MQEGMAGRAGLRRVVEVRSAVEEQLSGRIGASPAVASGAANFITYGTSNFATLFLMREKGMHLSEVAIWYALVVGVCMGGGIFVSGGLIDHFGARSKVAYAIIPAISLLLALPFFICFAWAARCGMASDYLRPTHGIHSLQSAFFALAPMYLIAALLFAALARRISRINRSDKRNAP